MKKIRLVGKKLYRVGPLKCYKDQHHSHGGDGVYSGSGSGGGGNKSISPSKPKPKKTKVVYDPVYGTAIPVTAAEYDIAVSTGAVGSGGDSTRASGRKQRIASNYLDQFKTDAQREEEARKKAEIEAEIDLINEDFKKSKDARSFLNKIGDVLETGKLAAFSDELTAKIETKKRQDTLRNNAIEEARRLGRIVVIDGLVYKPKMSTTGEQQRLQDKADESGLSPEAIRDLGFGKVSDEQFEKNLQDAKDGMAIDEIKKQTPPSFKLGLGPENSTEFNEMIGPDDPRYEAARSRYRSRLLQNYENKVRARQALMDKEKFGTLTPKEAQALKKLTDNKAVGNIAAAVQMGLEVGQAVADYISSPTGFTEAAEAEAAEEERTAGGPNEEPQRVEDVTDEKVKEQIRTFNLDKKQRDKSKSTIFAGDLPSGQTTVEPAPAPAAPAQLSLQEQLEKRARGEDLIAEREGKLARERGLAQQLATVRGARGVTAGQRLRALQRGGERLTTQLGAATAIEKAKEAQRAQDMLIDLEERERNRQAKVPTVAPVAAPPKRSDLSRFVDTASDVKDAFDLGKSLYDDFTKKKDDDEKKKGKAEGGFVSGPGTETSDSIPARLSDGEFVIKASAVRGIGKAMGAKDEGEERKKGVDFLYKLQDRMDKVEKRAEGGEIKADPERFLKFMDKGVSYSLMKKRIQKAKIPKEEKEKLLKGLGDEPKFAEGGEAYSRPKKAFREAIGYEPESRFHDKAFKDTKHGGARRKFRHFQDGGPVDMKGPGMIKEQFKMPSAGGFGSVVAAQADLQRRIEELERKVGK
tara:strand:- start:981 stop:3401 length:2421 start_codon:yes stop_codon:yes gene_type:complete